MIGNIVGWLTTAANWSGPDGVPTHLVEHLWYSLLAVAVAAVIALPIGLFIGHTGRGTVLVAGLANALRALPTLGLLILFVILLSPHISGNAVYLLPSEVVLVLLAVPPILTNTYAGVQNVPPATRDAAEGMGMTGFGVLAKVELPCALPLLLSGIRAATLQCIATATVAAYVSLGGFGRYIVDGLAQRDFPQMAAGALLVAVLALLADGLLVVLERVAVSPGVSGRSRRFGRAAADVDSDSSDHARGSTRIRGRFHPLRTQPSRQEMS
ncbi:MAG TPA: ABC transporter permease [Kineosporiaceae bacterium]|nr:ABC transporter permease [Kineosporiaceae bacterium]